MKHVICADCGSQDYAKKTTRGSFALELLLWLLGILPGLIYSIWRLSTRYTACAGCSSTRLLPVNSPAGRELVARFCANTAPHAH